MPKNSCESCLMPFSEDTGVREDPRYCSLCFRDGKLCYEGDDLKEFQRICKESMLAHGKPRWLASLLSWSIRFAPRWKKK